MPISLLDTQTCSVHISCTYSIYTFPTTGMSNTRPFASTPAARTKDTVIWSFNGQNCGFYNLNWINVRRSQKNGMIFFIHNVFYTWKYDRLFPSVKNILNKENILYVRHVKHVARGPHVALMTTQMWPTWPSGDPRIDMHALQCIYLYCNQNARLSKPQHLQRLIHSLKLVTVLLHKHSDPHTAMYRVFQKELYKSENW
jgi:hypothetical protein